MTMGDCGESGEMMTLVIFSSRADRYHGVQALREVKAVSPSMITVLGRSVPPPSRKTFLSFAVESTAFRLTLPTWHTDLLVQHASCVTRSFDAARVRRRSRYRADMILAPPLLPPDCLSWLKA
jgi:hypothetical protein